jgi:mRNA interferase MazF
MVIHRGEIWWANLGMPRGSGPGFERPVLIVQADSFNEAAMETAIIAALTSNIRLADMPGNVLIPSADGCLPKDSVVNVTQLFTVDRDDLIYLIGRVSRAQLRKVNDGLRLVLSI